MKDSEINEELLRSYIETETVSTARPLRPNDVQLSQLIREYYNNEKELNKEPIETSEKKGNGYSAGYNTLTGLINPPHMMVLLERFLQLAKEREKFLAIFYLELNEFEKINDFYGKAIADEVLTIIADRLKQVVRKSDLLSYLYENKFLVGFMLELKELEKVVSISEKITTVISKPIKVEGYRFEVGASISTVAYPFHGDKIRVLLDIAKMKMYKMNEGITY